MCTKAPQEPLNPHRQRLLAASARNAKVEATANALGKGKAKPKAAGKAKSKAKAKAIPKVTTAASAEDKGREESQEIYSSAKKAFMEEFLILSFAVIGCAPAQHFKGLLGFWSRNCFGWLSGFSHYEGLPMRSFPVRKGRRGPGKTVQSSNLWGKTIQGITI